MKVITLQNGAFAANPQTIISFGVGDVFRLNQNGLTEVNLNRMVELKLADFMAEDIDTVESLEVGDSTENREDSQEKIPEAYDFEAITDKAELIEYAKEIYGVDLPASKFIKKMIEALKAEIEKEGESK